MAIDEIKDSAAESPGLAPGADAAQNAAAQQVENPLSDVEKGREEYEPDQGRHAAARQHAVVDFEHEDRPGQIEQVDHAAHDADADEGVSTCAQCLTKLGTA